MNLTQLRRLVDPLARRIRGLAVRGVVRLVDDDRKLQELQVSTLAGDVRDRVEHFAPYGLTSRPHPGAEALVVALGGDREHSVVVAVADRRFRLTGLENGDVALYAADGFNVRATLVLRATGEIQVQTMAPVTITAPVVRIAGDLEVDGDVTATGDVADAVRTMQAERERWEPHGHTGVVTGGDVSGPPYFPP